MADYGCHPLWLFGEDLGDADPRDTRFGLSGELADRLDAWARTYEGILVFDDPVRSGFPSPEAKSRWVDEGHVIATDLAAELGADWTVHYFDCLRGRVSDIQLAK
ncbi:hypothetical protein ABZ719_23530 [Streptomyces sp. NPDC006743]|uniref:hypothetical protein n=1 Tax=Streptomyces sp. NPDC006743 TaxID=3154480 RepID=UPI003453A3BE